MRVLIQLRHSPPVHAAAVGLAMVANVVPAVPGVQLDAAYA